MVSKCISKPESSHREKPKSKAPINSGVSYTRVDDEKKPSSPVPFQMCRILRRRTMKSKCMDDLGGADFSPVALSARTDGDGRCHRFSLDRRDARRRGSLLGRLQERKQLGAQLERVLEKGEKFSETYTPTPLHSYCSCVDD